MATKSLDMHIGLVDKFTAPLRGITKQIDKLEKMTSKTPMTLQKIGTGALALWGVGKAFGALISPAVEMQKALDKAGLGGVKNLDQMRKQAKQFSGLYATSATDFVNSSVLIKNSIAGITDRALPKMTAKVNLMSKATGESVEESTKYVKQMLNDYNGTAKKMGGMKFVDQVSNMATYAKQNFGMSSSQMQAMMSSTKGSSVKMGVGMNDQFASMGVLSKSLGDNAGGSYDAMLSNMQNASKKLGLSFTDTNGKLLAMPDILDKIQGKFGKNIEGNVEAQKALDQAFGSGSKAMKTLLNNSDDFNQTLKAIGNNNGLSITQKMAEANVKPWDKINAQIANMSESIGHVLLPIFCPLFDVIGDLIGTIARWLEMFPNLAKWIGIIVAAFMGITAVAAVLSILSGALSLVLSPITLIVVGVIAIVAIIYYLWKNFDKVISLIVSGWNYFLDLLDNIVIFKPIVASIRLIGSIFSWVFNGIKNNWSYFVDAITNSTPFKVLVLIFDYISDGFKAMCALVTGDWDGFIDILTNNEIIKSFIAIGQSIASIFSSVISGIKNLFIDAINWVIDKANYIPGMSLNLISKDEMNQSNNLLTGNKLDSVEQGGISKELKENQSQTVDNSRNIGSITISAPNGITPEQLQEWSELQHG